MATYYIDPTGGNDGNTGLSEAQAWQNVNVINAFAFIPGDVIQIKRGETWAGFSRLIASGTAGNPITLQTYGTGAKPILDASATSQALFLRSVSYIVVQDLDLRDASNATIHVDQGCTNLTFQDLDISGGDYGIRLDGNTGGLSDITVDGCVITLAETDCILIRADVQDTTVRSCDISLSGQGGSGHGIRVGRPFADTGYTSCPDGISIHDNEVYSCVDGQGIRVADYSQNVDVYNNHCHDNNYSGIHMERAVRLVNVYDNICEDNSQNFNVSPGIWAGGADEDVEIWNNTCCGNAVGIYISANTEGVLVHHNLIYENQEGAAHNRGTCGIRIAGANLLTYTRDIEVYNNTLYDNGHVDNTRSSGITVGGDGFPDQISNVTIKNNIISESVGTWDLWVDPLVTNYVSDYNDYYNSSRALAVRWNGATETWAAYLTASSQDANSITDDPLFVNVANDNFYLEPDSPCIEAGTDVGLTSDYRGVSVPRGAAPDIGAYEYRNAVRQHVSDAREGKSEYGIAIPLTARSGTDAHHLAG